MTPNGEFRLDEGTKAIAFRTGHLAYRLCSALVKTCAATVSDCSAYNKEHFKTDLVAAREFACMDTLPLLSFADAMSGGRVGNR
jgi:hypothetical protein